MEILSSKLWWFFFLFGAASYFFSSFGGHGDGKKSKSASTIGTLGVVLFTLLSFVFLGWKGGLAFVVFMLFWVLITERIVWYIFKCFKSNATELTFERFVKRYQYRIFSEEFDSLSYSEKIGKLEVQRKKDDLLFANLSSYPIYVEILKQYGKGPDEIKNIFQNLQPWGYYVAYSVVEDPKLLKVYLEKEASNVPILLIAHYFCEILGR